MSLHNQNDIPALAREYQKTDSAERKKAIVVEILDQLKGLIVQDCNRFKGFAEFEDLQQEACLAVIEHLPEYNPDISKPTTFFELHINGALQKKCYGGYSVHYHDSIKKLRRICAENYGHDDFTIIDNVDLANISGMAMATIKECKSQVNYTNVSITATGDVEATGYNSSPEALVIENEKKELIVKAFSHLKPIEQFILQQYYLNEEENISVRQLVQILSQPENKKRFGLVGTVDTKFVTLTRERAMRILRQSSYLKPYNVRNEDNTIIKAWYTVEEIQTEEADIEFALVNGTFDFDA